MRFREFKGGFQCPVSNEEQDILDKIEKGLDRSSLSQREYEILRKLVSRGLVIKSGKKFSINKPQKIWRNK